MKVESALFGVIGSFFAMMCLIYGFWSYWDEPVGTVGFALGAALCFMISFFCWWTGRKTDLRPDDNPEGEIDEIEGDYGFFSPYSWWPLYLGGAAALMFIGLAVGWWLVILAVPLVALASVGWVFEYFRGDDAI
ncbi:cytochrome c oxidase subunit 4 [Leekyejoonella antrihumi]|uniref:Cytochrome c oxidase polypeptide 4 n=1 Tax=Leekyejoonella antrihumi TaxID=1660198 RepID=A0A563E397_9MICO|nr:cytochrome c oxidase subunit 4 [Leekyejoonella antrihumi]TWP36997.1 cytochrome c oxidase subunit 4 [Leekyejoonella antrihumi]